MRVEKKLANKSLSKNSKIFNGQFPCEAMLAFHRKSFGIISEKLFMEFSFKNGSFEGVKSWRMNGD